MLNLQNFAPALKKIYTKEKAQNLTYKGNPLYASFDKTTDFVGKDKDIFLQFGNPQGRSANFQKAQGNKGNSEGAAFTVTRDRDYGLVSIDNETIEASKNDAGAFLSARKTEIDGIFRTMNGAMGLDIFGNGSGKRCQIGTAAAVNTPTVQLEDIQEIVHIERGMKLVASSTNGGGTVRAGAAYVVSVDRKVGSFKVAATPGGTPANLSGLITGVSAGDYLFVDGDYDAKIKGLQAWLPYGGPAAGTFFGVDRSVDPTRLAGVWEDLSSLTVEEALIEGCSLMGREGAMIDKIWISRIRMMDLIKALGTKVQYVDLQVTPTISFRGVRVQTDEGVVDVFTDRSCPKTSMFMLQSDTWKFESLGEAPRILNMDSLEALREQTADAIEVRIGYYGQVTCNAPGYNGHFKI